MPVTEITDEQNRALQRVAPRYLQGERDVSRRVHWAIEEFLAAKQQLVESKARQAQEKVEAA